MDQRLLELSTTINAGDAHGNNVLRGLAQSEWWSPSPLLLPGLDCSRGQRTGRARNVLRGLAQSESVSPAAADAGLRLQLGLTSHGGNEERESEQRAAGAGPE